MSSDSVSPQLEQRGKLAVIGLGYIGLPTAVVLAKHGWDVVGVDINEDAVALVNRGELPFVEEGLEEELAATVDSGALVAQTEMPKADVYIVAVPTPFKDGKLADLGYIDAAVDSLSPHLSGDELVILESTSPPGTTERMAQRVFDARPDLRVADGDGLTVHFAHAPERVLPGRIMEEMVSNDRIVGGLTEEATRLAAEVYASFCEGEVSTTDARTAEMAKLTENAFRDVNIAFANELSLIADELDIDVWELIALANRHPRVNILEPGPGVGGHCIAVDPWFIVESAPEASQLIHTARLVNDGKPAWVIEQVQALLMDADGDADPVVSSTETQRVAILGLAFKPNIDDLRGSPSVGILRDLALMNPRVEFLAVEPNIKELPASLADLENVRLFDQEQALADSGIVVLLVDHNPFKQIPATSLEGKRVLDTRGVWR